jgi:oxygen-dependent protoporphyrinogen oxidase
MTCVVVGAGLTGLSAAWELTRAGTAVVVLESERRTGGVVLTERRDGFLVEGGPDGFLAADDDIPALAAELGLRDRLVDQAARGSMVWTGRRLEPIAEGRAAELLGIQLPTDVGAVPTDVGAQHAAPLQHGFRSFAAGMAELTEALAARLGPIIRTTQGVTGIAPTARGWRLAVTGGSSLEADGVVLGLPAWGAARLLAAVGVAGARELDDVVYAPSVTASLAYRRDQLNGRLEGSGFVRAAETDGAVRACTYAWLKYPARAPSGYALLRAFLEPADGDPAALAHGELAPVLGLSGAPLWTRAFHWSRGLPRYRPGHAERVARVREQLGRLAPLDIAGAGFDGAGVSACVWSGREAARRMVDRLKEERRTTS